MITDQFAAQVVLCYIGAMIYMFADFGENKPRSTIVARVIGVLLMAPGVISLITKAIFG